jgi:hypothetical protein
MNREDIIRMAREAGFEFKDRAEPKLERFAALVAAAERKRLLDAAECCRMREHGGVCYEKAKGNEAD